jgi:predicted 3-demethylubiquinone-9 3-methyltransferase (glyoxalase superfamily)
MAKNTICLWYDKDAEAAARFYAETFPDSAVGAVHRAPSDYPSGKEGDVLMVDFTVAGIPCIGLNGGPTFKHNEAFSFQIATDDRRRSKARVRCDDGHEEDRRSRDQGGTARVTLRSPVRYYN